MKNRSLEEIASFVRDLGSECTCLVIHKNMLISGSKDGRIVSWDIDNGHEKWQCKVDGPISDIGISDRIYFTASAELHAMKIETGELEWTVDIGGSSDLIKIDNDSIWVTSSLYEIEVQDYTETTLLKFDRNSKLIKKIIFEEKPWFIGMSSNDLVLGIGRPRCGCLFVNSDYVLSHKKIEGNSPITMGIETELGFLLGHSNGMVTEIKDGVMDIIQFEEYPISSVLKNEHYLCVGNDNGTIISSKDWERNFVGKIDCLIKIDSPIWASNTANENNIYVLDEDNGNTKYKINHDSRVRLIKYINGKIALSDQKGKVILLEEDVVFRRLNEVSEIVQDQEKRDLLKKRLRALRK